ncbi:PAS domain S-box protein [Candidatus Bathyarchaeota archaeon]|nr:PAS domain S-box protein [Candidatus Bathyarchaeota archaeon]
MPPEPTISVLHVDDDPNQLQIAKLILERTDPTLHVQTAQDPHEALHMITHEHVDCIVTDYKMPDLNGIQLATKIRQHTDTPIILYTGQGSEELAEEAFTVGVDDYIRKESDPGHYQVLAKRIRSAVDKHRAESHLQKSEENYRNVIDHANQGIIVIQDGLLRFINPRITEITGYTPEEALGKPFIDYLHPEDRHEALEQYRDRDPSGDTFYPFRIIAKNGDVLWIEVNGIGIDWDGGAATLHFITDITERKQAEEKIQERERMFRDLAEQSPSMIFINRGGRVLYTNKMSTELLGYKREEFYSPDFDFMSLIAPESLETIRANYAKHQRGEDVAPYEYALLRKDGIRLDAIISTKLISYGGETSILGVVTDISERTQMENSLRDSEERYRTLFETSPFAISIHDLNGEITSVNTAFTVLTGFTEKELKGKTLSTIASKRKVGQEKIDFIAEMRRALLSDGALSSFEYPFKRKDGKERCAQVHASLLHMDGKRTGIQVLAHDITDQKTMREELQRSEENFKRLIESAPDAITTADLRGYITLVNQKVTQVTGIPREELVGKHITQLGFITPEYRSILLKMMGPVLRGELPGPFKVRMRREDGSHILSEVQISSLKENGKTIGFQAISRDITERQRMEDERILYQERLEALHRHTLDLGEARNLQEVAKRTLATIEKVHSFDIGGFAIVDEDVLRMIYTTGSEVDIGHEWPLDGPGITVRTVRTGESQLVPDVRLDEDYHPGLSRGLYEVLSELAVPIKSEGEVIGLINVESHVLDAFTEQDKKLLETLSQNVGLTLSRLRHLDLLQASEARYRTFLDSSRDAIFVLDDKQYLYVNKSGADLLGYADPAELIGTTPLKHISPKDREMVENIMLTRQRGEEVPNRYEFRLIRTDGEEIVIETNVSLINYEGGPASLAVNRDITKQKRMEEELKEANLALEGLVEEKTQELLDAERLVTAGRIAATVGHDLRGPLQTIKNAIYLMKQSPESVDEMIDMINKSVDRASEMIDMFRSQTRYSPLILGDVNLVEMVRKAVEEATLPQSVEAVLELDERLESVYLDGTKINRVLDNLIQNAVEAMPTGGRLTVTAKRDRGKINLTVSDTGVGMPPDVIRSLFKPFHTTKEGGLGLGLYYCKRTVEAHEGTIELDSEVGAGTTFTIMIPVFTQDYLSHFEAQAIRSTLNGQSSIL